MLRPEDLDLFPALYRCFMAEGDHVCFDDESKHPDMRGWTDDGSGTSEEVLIPEVDKVVDRGLLQPRTRMKTKPVPIEICVEGVWDTVGSLGLPDSWLTEITGYNKRYQLHNTALNDSKANDPWTKSVY